MDENTANNKVLGLTSLQYVKVSYVLVGIAAGLGLLISVLTGIGLGAPSGGGLVNLVGFVGWTMALIGWLALGRNFTVIENSHLRFISLLFVTMLVLGIIIGSTLGASGVLWGIFSFILSVIAVGMLYLGFTLWQAREEVTISALKAEFETAKSRLTNRSDV